MVTSHAILSLSTGVGALLKKKQNSPMGPKRASEIVIFSLTSCTQSCFILCRLSSCSAYLLLYIQTLYKTRPHYLCTEHNYFNIPHTWSWANLTVTLTVFVRHCPVVWYIKMKPSSRLFITKYSSFLFNIYQISILTCSVYSLSSYCCITSRTSRLQSKNF